MVRDSREFKSEDPGFNPLAGQGKRQVFFSVESTLVQTCLCLTPLCAHVKDPISTCRKTVGITAGGMEKNENTAYRAETLGSAALWLLVFPQGKHPDIPMHGIGTRKFSNLT